MKLLKALKIADACGLPTVREAIRNIEIHATSLFKYDDVEKETRELLIDLEKHKKTHNISDNDYVWEVIKILESEE